ARGCREHPPSTHARHGEAGIADHAHGPVESRLGQLVAPHGDVRYAVTRTRFDGVLEARPLGGDLVQAEPVDRGGPQACSRVCSRRRPHWPPFGSPHPLAPSLFAVLTPWPLLCSLSSPPVPLSVPERGDAVSFPSPEGRGGQGVRT